MSYRQVQCEDSPGHAGRRGNSAKDARRLSGEIADARIEREDALMDFRIR